MTNGLSDCYHLDESTFIFRGIRSGLIFFIHLFDEFSLSKQNSPGCGVTSGAILFAYVSQKGCQVYMSKFATQIGLLLFYTDFFADLKPFMHISHIGLALVVIFMKHILT